MWGGSSVNDEPLTYILIAFERICDDTPFVTSRPHNNQLSLGDDQLERSVKTWCVVCRTTTDQDAYAYDCGMTCVSTGTRHRLDVSQGCNS